MENLVKYKIPKKIGTLFDKKIIRLDKNWDKEDNDESFLNKASNPYNPEIEINKEDLAIDINRVLAELTKKESSIIKYYFGLEDNSLSILEIGKLMSLSRERVRQILERAIRRLKHSSRSNVLRKYLAQ